MCSLVCAPSKKHIISPTFQSTQYIPGKKLMHYSYLWSIGSFMYMSFQGSYLPLDGGGVDRQLTADSAWSILSVLLSLSLRTHLFPSFLPFSVSVDIVLCLRYRAVVVGQCGKKNLLHCEDTVVNFSYRTVPQPTLPSHISYHPEQQPVQ